MADNNHIELALLTKVIETRDFHALDKAQITEEFFQTPIAREIYRFIRTIYHAPETTGKVPSLEYIQYHFPQSFYPFPSSDAVQVLAAELRRQKVRIEVLLLAQNVSEIAERDPMAAMAALRSEVTKISALAEVGQDLTLAGAFSELEANYNLVQDSKGVLGIPYPWDQVNEETQGMLDGQFIVLYARPKSMKTWLGLYMAIHAYRNCRRRVLFYSREMSPKLVSQRVAAAFCGVDYKAYKNGKLQPDKKAEVFLKLKELKDDEGSMTQYGFNAPFFKIISDRGGGSSGGGGGVSWLHAKVKECKPDIVFVDGMYLMKDDRSNSRSVDWKNIAQISQDLKGMAQDEDIPVVGITQATRASAKEGGKADLTGLAYSDSLAQDADAAFHIDKRERIDPNTKRQVTELFLTAPGLREGKFEGIVIHGEPATNFDWIRNITAADYQGGGDDYGEQKQGRKPSFSRPSQDANIPTSGQFKKIG